MRLKYNINIVLYGGGILKVIKKNKEIEFFLKEKLKSSILGASNDSKTILNESDLNIIVNEVLKKLRYIRGENGITSTYEIRSVTIEVLREFEFIGIIKEYLPLNK